MKKIIAFIIIILILAGCTAGPAQQTPAPGALQTLIPNTGLQIGKLPHFDHIILIVLENKAYSEVIGSDKMPELNALAQKNVLLTQYYAVAHPSLPNYIALLGGSTFDIKTDCTDCTVNKSSLPDLLEKSKLTWKTYQEGMPAPCFVGNSGKYMQKHNPFLYYDAIRTNPARCESSVLPMKQLAADLKANALPNFAFITPNMCNSGHDCGLETADKWIKSTVDMLQSSPALGKNSLIVITFDEGAESDSTPGGGLAHSGGRVAAVLISPQAKAAFQDDTPYSHYSLLKTILQAWGLPPLAQTANPEVRPIIAPWK